MKKYNFLLISIACLVLSGCQAKSSGSSEPVIEYEEISYVDKNVILHKNTELVEPITLRFFEDQPNVPYITVKDYYKRFFNTDLIEIITLTKHTYSKRNGSYVSFDYYNEIFTCYNLYSFSSHPDFPENNYKLFIKSTNFEYSTPNVRTISLKNYSIKTYKSDQRLYVPFTLLSNLFGGLSGYDVAYNCKDIYVFDYHGNLGEPTRDTSYEDYFSVLNDTTTERPQDLANYVYNELCFLFDNLRGYTSQLVFGDNNLLSLGLNGILETYYPEMKSWLLSTNKLNYLEAFQALFSGLSDGGHTGIITSFNAFEEAKNRRSYPSFNTLNQTNNSLMLEKAYVQTSALISRRNAFGSMNNNYYYFDSTSNTSYIGFKNFEVDYEGWNNYYNGIGEVPVTTDSYAFIRDKLYTAKSDGAENVVIDITYNGGGNSYALEGIVGLFNGGKSYFCTNETVNNFRMVEKHAIDINLDGNFDELDEREANSFDFNVGVLTSSYSFSCGNLFPSVMKEIGYKILGEKSGGGSCAVALNTTADGIPFQNSSHICLCNESGENIDGGVSVDFEIPKSKIEDSNLYDYEDFFNVELVSNYLSNAYNL